MARKLRGINMQLVISIIIFCAGEWTSRIVHLLNDQHMGVVTAAASLIDALVKKNPDEYKVGRIRNTYCLHKLIYMSALCLWYQIN